MAGARLPQVVLSVLAVACVAFAGCSSRPSATAGTGPMPAAGSGIHAPEVDPALPADFAFRWPANARARVTVRIEATAQPENAVAVAQTITLGPHDSDGLRHLSATEFVGVGGQNPDLAAIKMSGAPRAFERELVVGKDAVPVPATTGYQWRLWVWTMPRAELAKELGPDVALTFDADEPSPFGRGAVRRGFRVQAKTPEAAHALSQRGFDLLGASQQTGVFGAYHVVLDTVPQTLQPLRVMLSYDLERPVVTTFTMTYEFDWRAAAP